MIMGLLTGRVGCVLRLIRDGPCHTLGPLTMKRKPSLGKVQSVGLTIRDMTRIKWQGVRIRTGRVV